MREDLRLADQAVSLGWVIEYSDSDVRAGRTGRGGATCPADCLSFRRPDVHDPEAGTNLKYLWSVRDGWNCADLINGSFQNHRTYRSLEEALVGENE